MKKLFDLVKSVIANVVESEEERFSVGLNRLLWNLNLPIFAKDEDTIIFRSPKEEEVILPEEKVVELINAEAQAHKALDDARDNAAKKLHLDGWSEAEELYKTAKADLVAQGKYGLPIEEIPHGKEVADFRKAAADGDAAYEMAQRWYWNIQPTAKRAFYTHASTNGNTVKGLNEFFPTPVLAEDHPFAKTYWEEIRALLPNWAVQALRRDASSRIPIEKPINRSNGVWDSNACSGRSKKEEEKTDSDKLFDLLMSKFSYILRDNGIEDLDGSPKTVLHILNDLVKEGEVSPYAIAYKLVEFVNSGWITTYDIKAVTGFDDSTYEFFKTQYEQDLETNDIQRKNRIIDSYVGEWYTLSMMANLDKEDIFQTLKEGMLVNCLDYYAPMIEAQEDEKSLWKAYSRIPFAGKSNGHMNKQELLALSPNYNALREKAGNNLQDNAFAMRKLAETNKYQLNTGDKEWDTFLVAARNAMMETVGDMSQRLRINYGSTLASSANDTVFDVAVIKAAYNLFAEAQKAVETAFGTLDVEA